MNRLRKLISLIVVACLISAIVPGFFSSVFAAAAPVGIHIDSYDAGTLKISWINNIPGVDTVRLIYHVPDNIDNSTAIVQNVPLAANATSAEISAIRNDFIYDIRVQFSNSGIVVGEGLLYFMAGITFTSAIVNETVVDSGPDFDPPYDPNGGREIGTKPRLTLRWNMPKVYNGSFFDYSQNALGYMQSQINGVYNEGRVLSSLSYRINISSNANDMSLIDAVIVNGITNRAHVSGYDSEEAIVGISGSTMSLDLQGRASATSALPVTSGGILGHREILPGTVYYMTVQTVFNSYTDAVIMDKGATPLSGKPYTYTPIRFQLSKDDTDNVFAKVYTVNQGSLQLPDLYYEVQINTSDSEYGWDTKAQLDPDYFKDSNGNYLEYGVIPIIGISANNNLYYRIVATSSSNDSIKSQNLPYKMAQDKSRPPIPKGISIVRKVFASSNGKKSTDVTISWDKPANWDEIKSNIDPSADVYFCFMLNINQTEILQPPFPVLEAEDGTTYEFPAKYRLVRYINARSVWDGVGVDPHPERDKLVENGNRLEYTLKGFDMFKWTDKDGNLTDYPPALPAELRPEIGYPAYLLSNTVYYMQMYTTKGTPGNETGSSDRSVTTSFTTLAGLEKDVPLANNFMLTAQGGNTVVMQGDKVVNTVKLQFDTIQSINWRDYDTTPLTTTENKIYYDLFMSTSTAKDTETLIGSTDDDINSIYPNQNNVAFEFVVDAQNRYVIATISHFDKDPAVTSFGSDLTPNTTYYFKLRTRLVMPDSSTIEKKSKFTSLIAVTTLKGPITPPNDADRIPVAPVDFAIAKDAKGNLLVSGSSVTFKWLRKESDVSYTLVCTSERLPMNASSVMYDNDALYQDFKSSFGFIGTGIVLDPNPAPNLPAENFSYDPAAKICTFKVNKGLFPNRLYYFSLRAERKTAGGKRSVWISVPVTTSLIEAPTQLEPVNSPQLGFFWFDADTAIQPDEYKIYLKGPDEKDYKLISRSQLTVVKDGKTYEKDGELCYLYYSRIFSLKPNTTYRVAVYKGKDNNKLVYKNDDMFTKDGAHEVQARWKGIAGNKYEAAIKAAGDLNYTTLTDADFEIYADAQNESHPYYFEETNQTNKDEYGCFYVRIKDIPVVLSDGRIEHRPLKSNIKYQIKVRAVKTDTLDPSLVAYSKYAGPIETRTEFDQGDYDSDEEQKNNEISFLDRIKKLEERIFWRVGISSSLPDKILLKGERLANTINNSGSFPVIVDMSAFNTSVAADVVFIPVGIAETLYRTNKNMTVKTYGVDYVIGPGTIDLENSPEIKTTGSKPGVKDLFLRLTSIRSEYPQAGYPSGTKRVSKVAGMEFEILGMNLTDIDLEKAINNKIYNSQTGLVKKKSNALGSISGSIMKDKQKLGAYLDELAGDVEVDLSQFINNTLEGGNGVLGSIISTAPVKKFNSPMQIRLAYTDKTGYKLPYALYKGAASWQRISKNITDKNGYLSFNAVGTGKFAILASAAVSGDVPSDYWAKGSIDKLMSKFDLSEVLAGIGQSFSPESEVLAKEAVLLYEKVLGTSGLNVGMDVRQKAKSLGLDDIFNLNGLMKPVTKQQLAALAVRIYSKKSGVDLERLKPAGNIYISDEASIDDSYYKYVIAAFDLKLMVLDGDGVFKPKKAVTRADTADILVKTLKLTGDM